MNEDKVKTLLETQIILQDTFQVKLMKALEPFGTKGDIFSNVLATSTDLRLRCRRALDNIEKGDYI